MKVSRGTTRIEQRRPRRVVKQEYLLESAEDASSLTIVTKGYALFAQGPIGHIGRERRGEKRALKQTASRMAAIERSCQDKQGALRV